VVCEVFMDVHERIERVLILQCGLCSREDGRVCVCVCVCVRKRQLHTTFDQFLKEKKGNGVMITCEELKVVRERERERKN